MPVYISLNYNISYKFSTATGIDIGKNMAGTYLETAFAPDKGTPQAKYTSGKAVEPGWVCSDKGLPYIWDQMKKMMTTAKFFSAATPKFRGDFVVQKVSQEDAAFILAWLSDPSASKRAHSAVDLTADGLARPANCINDMRSHQEPALVPISWCFIAAAGLQLHVQLGLRLFFVCLPHS